MTTAVNIHVNGRYRATVHQDHRQPVIVEGNYEGSPNPSGAETFWLPHPAQSTFRITEEAVPEEPASHPDTVVSATEAPAAAETNPPSEPRSERDDITDHHLIV